MHKIAMKYKQWLLYRFGTRVDVYIENQTMDFLHWCKENTKYPFMAIPHIEKDISFSELMYETRTWFRDPINYENKNMDWLYEPLKLAIKSPAQMLKVKLNTTPKPSRYYFLSKRDALLCKMVW